MMGMFRTIIQQFEDTYAPPEENVLEVEIVGQQVFLTISKLEENNRTSTYVRQDSVSVHVDDLVRAVNGMFFFPPAEEPDSVPRVQLLS